MYSVPTPSCPVQIIERGGEGGVDVMDHRVSVDALRYTEYRGVGAFDIFTALVFS